MKRPEALDDERLCYVLFHKRVFKKRGAEEVLAKWGFERAKVENGAVFWRYVLRPIPTDVAGTQLATIEPGIYGILVNRAGRD